MSTATSETGRYTDEQRRALASPEPVVALEAGAGCGKTFVLTERLLAHLDPVDGQPPAVDEVVAITFTDAAAREMRDRVRRECLDRLQRADGSRRGPLRRLLRSLDAARVSTIHAFCGGLLRTHAVAMGLDPGFTVLEQATADVMRSEATDACLRDSLDRQNESVLALAAEFGVSGLRQRLIELPPLDDALRQAWLAKSTDEVVTGWRAASEQLTRQVLEEICDSPALDRLIVLLHSAEAATDGFRSKRELLLDLIAEIRSDQARPALLGELRDGLKLHGSYRKSWPDPSDYDAFKQAADSVKKLIAGVPVLASGDALRHAADLGLALLRESARVEDAYLEAKRSANGLDYDDLLRETHRLLTDPEHAGIQHGLRRDVRLLLVDEFQDTDGLQAGIVRALVGLHASDEPDTGADAGRLFFVGDFKQSIYRFRGAEPRV
ncbi:MAG: UvrD-helicase domain-containing protein, partial [Planctomycetota bacterium]